MEKYQIFISYRRDGGDALAGRLADRFTALGYKVFFDVESMRSGTFNTQLLDAIAECDDMLVVLPPNALDRCINEDDWVRQELAFAIKNEKNIIPVIMRGFSFPDFIPDDINKIRFMEGVNSSSEYFDAVISRIESLLISKKSSFVSNNSAAAPLLKRAFMFLEDGDFINADAYFEKVLDLDPECHKAYLGKFMVENSIKTEAYIATTPKIFDTSSKNFRKAYAFATQEEKQKLDDMVHSAAQMYEKTYSHLWYPQQLFRQLSSRISCGENQTSILLLNGAVVGTGKNLIRLCKKYNFSVIKNASTLTNEFRARDNSFVNFYTYSTADGRVHEIRESYTQDSSVRYHAPVDYNWTRIIKTACRYHHTAGLRNDGTVVAAGDNSDHSCNVDSWKDIVDIACGEHHTVGLKKDGTVVACGAHPYNLDFIEYGTNYGQCDVADWKNISVICCDGSSTYGVTKEGTVCVTGHACQNKNNEMLCTQWTDIVGISAGNCHIVGLKSDGTVVACGNNNYGQCNVSGWTDVVCVACGYDYTIGIRKDGTILACGDNSKDQCKIIMYKLFTDPEKEKAFYTSLYQSRTAARVCQHCGGKLKGLFKPECSFCGQEKDY